MSVRFMAPSVLNRMGWIKADEYFICMEKGDVEAGKRALQWIKDNVCRTEEVRIMRYIRKRQEELKEKIT